MSGVSAVGRGDCEDEDGEFARCGFEGGGLGGRGIDQVGAADFCDGEPVGFGAGLMALDVGTTAASI